MKKQLLLIVSIISGSMSIAYGQMPNSTYSSTISTDEGVVNIKKVYDKHGQLVQYDSIFTPKGNIIIAEQNDWPFSTDSSIANNFHRNTFPELQQWLEEAKNNMPSMQEILDKFKKEQQLFLDRLKNGKIKVEEDEAIKTVDG